MRFSEEMRRENANLVIGVFDPAKHRTGAAYPQQLRVYAGDRLPMATGFVLPVDGSDRPNHTHHI